MKIDRRHILQFAEIRARNPKVGARMTAFGQRLTAIEALLDHVESIEAKAEPAIISEILRYIPIATIAMLQGYMTTVIRDLVDSDNGRSATATQLFKDVSFKLESLTDINQHSMTIGEIAASAMTFSSVSAIQSALTELLGENAKEAIGRQHFSEEEGLRSYAKILDATLTGVAKAFRFRHIFCHELATSESLTRSDADNMHGDVVIYIIGIERTVNAFAKSQRKTK